MSDLIVADHAPVLGSGRALRLYTVVRALAALGPVDMLYVPFGGQPAPEFRAIGGLRLEEVRPTRGARRAAAYARSRLRGTPGPLARPVSSEMREAAERLASVPGRGRVIADGPSVAAALWRLAGRRPVIYNAHNVESSFRDAVEPGWNPRTLRRFERRLLERAAESWMVSPSDMEAARALNPDAVLRYVPNGVDVEAIAPVSPPEGAHRVLFVGDFTYAPNRMGLRFLLDEVMPSVWAEIPAAEVAIVGRGLDAAPSGDARVRWLGFVDDLGEVYRSASCVAVPLTHGGGSPLKFIEAMAYGLPVVATPRGAAGLEARAGEHYLEGTDAAGFAAALATALRGEGAGLGAAGRALAERRYSVAALSRAIGRPRPG